MLGRDTPALPWGFVTSCPTEGVLKAEKVALLEEEEGSGGRLQGGDSQQHEGWGSASLCQCLQWGMRADWVSVWVLCMEPVLCPLSSRKSAWCVLLGPAGFMSSRSRARGAKTELN